MGLTHFDKEGNANMVDVSEKSITKRCAVAKGKIKVNQECFQTIADGTLKKGDVLGVARIAGIMGVKRTADLIPLCHSLPLLNVQIDFQMLEDSLEIACTCTVKVEASTGVEMEALTGVSVALLTVYDMCKAIDKSMEIGHIYLCEKKGGKSGEYRRE
jgi:molybdenum cofactor biosynthesis protein MoaC